MEISVAEARRLPNQPVARHSGIFRAQEIWTVRSITDSRLSLPSPALRLSPVSTRRNALSSSSQRPEPSCDRLSSSLHGVDGCRRGPAPQELPRGDEVKKQYRKLSLLVHPDKCKHPKAQEAFAALAKAQQLLLDPQERGYILDQVIAAKEELRAKRKKELKKDSASKIKSQVDEGKYEEQYERSEEFQKQLIIKVREILTDKEWRRRKMQMRISEEEGRLKKDEEETKEMWKRKREHEEKWEETRDQRVSSWRDFMKTGKKARKGEIKPPKLKTEDPNKSYVQRPVKRA
ncbi:hypothetical protein E2562_032528 [Oryza meyeriana var. granulata]|uniref:J domain-containing protein n=1 Tax=Oryza meyeriana var. granulata TaxID=110450 RepID=A0A6G1DRL1_9ORYZ|nr:hypothetical protein E2562_032528 [Oryza meyeriana var. granulata]